MKELCLNDFLGSVGRDCARPVDEILCARDDGARGKYSRHSEYVALDVYRKPRCGLRHFGASAMVFSLGSGDFIRAFLLVSGTHSAGTEIFFHRGRHAAGGRTR